MDENNTRERWDAEAGEYQKVFRLGRNDYNEDVFRYWKERDMLAPGMRVLDIGCGVGKYGVWFSEMGCDVTLTDISGEMLRRAEENLEGTPGTWRTFRCDFSEITGGEEVFRDGFDLSISTMSPAVHDRKTVALMSGMTRGWCFLTRFYDWQQPVRDRILQAVGAPQEGPFRDLKGEFRALMDDIRAEGWHPDSQVVFYDWYDDRTPEEMTEYMLRNYLAEDPDREAKRSDILEVCRTLADGDGKIRDEINTTVMWIRWNTEESDDESGMV